MTKPVSLKKIGLKMRLNFSDDKDFITNGLALTHTHTHTR